MPGYGSVNQGTTALYSTRKGKLLEVSKQVADK